MCRYYQILLAIVFQLILTSIFGCATPARMYSGEALPNTKTAVISGNPNITFLRVDKKTFYFTPCLSTIIFTPVLKSVEVLPGKHNLRVIYKSSKAEAEISLVAVEGHRYAIKSEDVSTFLSKIRFWVEDEATGKPVGEVKSTDDEPKSK